MDTNLFTPWDAGSSPSEQNPARAEEAKRVCARCPVSAACLAEATQAGDMHSICGGMTPKERRLLVDEHVCTVCGRSFGSVQGLGRHKATHDKIECGTPRGYWLHKRSGQQPCGPCNDAIKAYKRSWASGRAS